MKTIAISGASGFVGQSLTDFFSKQNYKVVQIKRDILNNSLKLDELINSSDVVINLSGANIINRWSESYKKLLISKPSPFVNTNLDFLFIPTIYATPSSTSLAL